MSAIASHLTTILIDGTLRAMYVCICNGHTDGQIRKAAETTGLRCAKQIYRHLGKPARCGRCLEVAAEVVAAAHTTSDASADVRRAS